MTMVMPGHSLRPIELISFMEIPNAPSPAKPTHGMVGLPTCQRLGVDDECRLRLALHLVVFLPPLIRAMPGKGRKGVDPDADRQPKVARGEQYQGGFRAVVAEGAEGKPMAAGEAVVVLV